MYIGWKMSFVEKKQIQIYKTKFEQFFTLVTMPIKSAPNGLVYERGLLLRVLNRSTRFSQNQPLNSCQLLLSNS